jgi:hypothetical protein
LREVTRSSQHPTTSNHIGQCPCDLDVVVFYSLYVDVCFLHYTAHSWCVCRTARCACTAAPSSRARSLRSYYNTAAPSSRGSAGQC